MIARGGRRGNGRRRQLRVLAAGLGLALFTASCTTSDDDGAASGNDGSNEGTTTTPLGYPTTTTTLPPAAELPPGDDATDPAAIAPIVESNWTLTGHRSITPDATISVLDFGAVAGDGDTDTPAFEAAVDAAAAEAAVGRPTAVTIPAGTFLLTDTLALQSGVVLRGDGPDQTNIELDLGGADIEGITMVGAPSGAGFTALTATAERGDTTIRFGSFDRFEVGSIVEIEQDNVDRMQTRPEWDVDWDDGSSGEVALVVAGDNGEATLAHRTHDTYDVARNARVRALDAIEAAGIESMRIERIDAGYGNTVAMRFGHDLWLTDLELVQTSRAHIAIDVVANCSVIGSSIHGAHDFGDGGRAYGISAARHTTGCRFEDNALWDLRHAMIIQLGAAGNVFGYNDARGSAGYEDRQPRADISLHGHWPQLNLFEGNVVDRMVFADWWGPSGPGNVKWRGCALDFIQLTEKSNDQAVLASVIGPGGFTIDDDIEGTVAAANVVDGEPSPDLVDVGVTPLRSSLYGASMTPPTVNDCRVPASDRNPWAQPGAERP